MVPGKLQSRAEPEADLSALLAVRQQLPHCGIWAVKSKRIAIVVYSSVRYSEWQLPDYFCPPAGMECSHSWIRVGSDLSTSSKRSKSASALRSTQRSSYLYAARDAHYSIHWPCRSRKRGGPHHSHTTPHHHCQRRSCTRMRDVRGERGQFRGCAPQRRRCDHFHCRRTSRVHYCFPLLLAKEREWPSGPGLLAQSSQWTCNPTRCFPVRRVRFRR